jgi:tRNA modification GTPase
MNRIEFLSSKRLIDSFAVGNVIKNGIPVGCRTKCGKIDGRVIPERAVSEIAGTTRDTIEDELVIAELGLDF